MKKDRLKESLLEILSGEREPSSVEFESTFCQLIDKLVDNERLPPDAERGVLTNLLDYVEQARKDIEPTAF